VCIHLSWLILHRFLDLQYSWERSSSKLDTGHYYRRNSKWHNWSKASHSYLCYWVLCYVHNNDLCGLRGLFSGLIKWLIFYNGCNRSWNHPEGSLFERNNKAPILNKGRHGRKTDYRRSCKLHPQDFQSAPQEKDGLICLWWYTKLDYLAKALLNVWEFSKQSLLSTTLLEAKNYSGGNSSTRLLSKILLFFPWPHRAWACRPLIWAQNFDKFKIQNFFSRLSHFSSWLVNHWHGFCAKRQCDHQWHVRQVQHLGALNR